MKTSAVIRIVIWSFVALILTGVLISVIVLHGSHFGSGDFAIGFSGNTYSDADSYNIGGGSISEKINAVTVNWVSGKIDISVYDGDMVEISETPIENEDYKLRYKVENGKLTVHSEKSGINFGIISRPKKELTIKIPRSYAEDFRKLKIDATSAEININGITASESVEIDTVSGGVTAKEITVVSLECNTVSGDIKTSGAISRFDFESISGNAEIVSSVPLKKLETDTVSGDVTVTIPENDGFELEYDTVSGDLDCDFALTKKKEKSIYKNGSAEFEADSTSGDLTIKMLS